MVCPSFGTPNGNLNPYFAKAGFAKCRAAMKVDIVTLVCKQLEMGSIEPIGNAKEGHAKRRVPLLAPPTGIEPITNP